MSNEKVARKRAPGVLSRQELTEASKELRKALVAHSGGSNEAVKSYLEVFAGFKRNGAKKHGMFRGLSARNMALIEAQRGERQLIGLFAGPRQWEKLDRKLLVDAKPLTIWVPSVRKVDTKSAVTASSSTTASIAKAVKADVDARLVGWGTAGIYDWSDTISTDPEFIEPSWEAPLFAGDEETLEALTQATSIPIKFQDLGGRSEVGHTDGDEIVIDTGSAAGPRLVGNLISTLAHELVHVELGHPDKLKLIKDKQERSDARAGFEAEAALGEFLLLKSLGLDEAVGAEITKAAADYLSSWLGADNIFIEGHKGRMKLFDARLEKARVAVDAIISRALGEQSAVVKEVSPESIPA